MGINSSHLLLMLSSLWCSRSLGVKRTLILFSCKFTEFFFFPVRDTFCSYGVMELCSKGLGTSTSAMRARGVNLSCVRTLCVIAEERPRINLTTNFAKLFSALNLTPRAVSTSFGCRVNVGICLQVCYMDLTQNFCPSVTLLGIILSRYCWPLH